METQAVKPNDIVDELDICVTPTIADSELNQCYCAAELDRTIDYVHTYTCTEVILSLGNNHLNGNGIMNVTGNYDLDHEV